jgi:diguanylate cyclase
MTVVSAEEGKSSADRLVRGIRRTQSAIAAAYAYDVLILFGFYAAGYVDLSVPVCVSAALAVLLLAVDLGQRSGRSRNLKDPTVFLPQQLYAIGVALGVALAAPQIAFQPLATLFAISVFAFMAPDGRSQLVGAGAAALGAACVIFVMGSRLAMPTGTLAGQALTSAVMLGALARCIWVAALFARLRDRLREKNKALKAAVERIDALASRDDLTGLPNRRAITNWVAEQVSLCNRTGLALSIALIDFDHFKGVNDAHGHLAGDRALQIFSNAAAKAIRTTDRLGRFGGDEFLLVLAATRLGDAEAVLNRVRERIAACDWSPIDGDLNVTVTVGATQYVVGDSVEELVRRADLALYLGKELGRDRVVLDRVKFEEPERRVAV